MVGRGAGHATVEIAEELDSVGAQDPGCLQGFLPPPVAQRLARTPSATSPRSPPVAITTTTRWPAAAAFAIVPPQAIASSSGWAWKLSRVAMSWG